MRHIQYIIGMVILGLAGNISAQELDDHLWKNRLVLVYTEDPSGSLYKEQIEVLKGDIAGLEDRKLVIYHYTPDAVKKGLEDGKWKKRDDRSEKYTETKGNFEVLLLGLDGRVKLRQQTLLSREKLYSTIDAMPMRQSELRRRETQ